MVPESHPLQGMIVELVNRHYSRGVGMADSEITAYVAAMLIDFCDGGQLFKVKNEDGRPLEDVGAMLLESDPVYGPAPCFDRERQVRKHIGDYTLFFAGMFPESINAGRLRRQRLENFVDFIKAGKESYYVVSKFEHFEYAKVAPLFARLSREFERCVYGLNLVKDELQGMRYALMPRSSELIM